ncbi:futalosine hydrolase [Desulfovibrio sp. JY]|nr:futalosine hydrolase [Desulfovibrio sp. JY]
MVMTQAQHTDSPLVIVLATAKEYKAALSPLGAPAAPEPGGNVFWRRGGREHLVCVTGVGPVAAAASLGLALGRLGTSVSGVINLGLAGSFDFAAAPLRGIVAATAEAFPEYGLRAKAGVDTQGLGFPQLTLAGAPVFDHMVLAPDAGATAMGLRLPDGCALGAAVTVAGVSGEPDRAAILSRKYKAATESMEGFAVAMAASLAGVPFLELRAISNKVGSRPPEDWDLSGALAALGRAADRLLS